MDLNKIFTLFTDSTESIANTRLNSVQDLRNSPAFLTGMFYKLINREDEIHLHAIIQNLDVDEEVRENIKEVNKLLTYTHAYGFLCSLNLNNPEHLTFLRKYSNPAFKNAATKALKYFESTEEYERCDTLQKIIKELPTP